MSMMKRLDQGHLNPNLEVRRLSVWNRTRAFMVGGEHSRKSSLQIILDLCVPEKEIAKTRSQISFI